MNDGDLKKHNWAAVQAALFDLVEHTQEHEPHAVNFIAAVEEVIAGLPE